MNYFSLAAHRGPKTKILAFFLMPLNSMINPRKAIKL